MKSNAILQNRVLSKVWLLPQFICMTFGETLFAMTGLSFSFSEVNKNQFKKSKINFNLINTLTIIRILNDC